MESEQMVIDVAAGAAPKAPNAAGNNQQHSAATNQPNSQATARSSGASASANPSQQNANPSQQNAPLIMQLQVPVPIGPNGQNDPQARPRRSLYASADQEPVHPMDMYRNPGPEAPHDIVFRVGRGADMVEIGAHSPIVVPKCKRMADMLATTEAPPGQKKRIDVFHLDPLAVDKAMEWFYTGQVALNSTFAMRVLQFAEHFGIAELDRLVSNYIQRYLNPTNALKLFDEAIQLGLHRIRPFIKGYVELNASACLMSPALPTIPKATLQLVLSSNTFHVDEEFQVYQALVRWGTARLNGRSANRENFRKILGMRLIYCVRMKFISSHDRAHGPNKLFFYPLEAYWVGQAVEGASQRNVGNQTPRRSCGVLGPLDAGIYLHNVGQPYTAHTRSAFFRLVARGDLVPNLVGAFRALTRGGPQPKVIRIRATSFGAAGLLGATPSVLNYQYQGSRVYGNESTAIPSDCISFGRGVFGLRVETDGHDRGYYLDIGLSDTAVAPPKCQPLGLVVNGILALNSFIAELREAAGETPQQITLVIGAQAQ